MTTRKFPLLSLLLLLTSLLVVGCGGGHKWIVIRQAVPDPFAGHPQVIVEPVHFDQARVGEKSEVEYASEKKAEAQDKWEDAKAAFSESFGAALAQSPGVQVGPQGAVVRPIVTFIEPGYYAFVSARPSIVRLTIQLLDPQGAPQDEIVIEVKVGASMNRAGVGTRLREAGERMGTITGAYLRTRINPG
jgi:hypothetical protein